MDEVNYDLYPDREEQLTWLRHYLETKSRIAGETDKVVTDTDLDTLYVQVNKCACVSCLFVTTNLMYCHYRLKYAL